MHTNLDPRVLQAGGDGNGNALEAVAYGVVDQILQDLANAAGIDEDGWEIRRKIEYDRLGHCDGTNDFINAKRGRG
jgi:hypothetical protein